MEQSVRDGAVTGQFGFYGLEEISVWASLEDERLLHALPHTLSFFILFLLFYTVFQFYSNYNSSKVRREHPTFHPVEKSIMEVEIMLSLITIDTENCKSDFPPTT